MKKRNSFTLAEVLITLTIIGVIAALTIPNLMQKWQDQHTVSAVKEAYSIFDNAFKLAVRENGDVRSWISSNNYMRVNGDIIAKNLMPYLRINKYCGNGGSVAQPCTSYNWKSGSDLYVKNLNGYNSVRVSNDNYDSARMVLANGMLASITLWNYRLGQPPEGAGSGYGAIKVDINGKKGPNRVGYDIFSLQFNDKGLLANPSHSYFYSSYKTKCSIAQNSTEADVTKTNGSTCYLWIMKKGNVDYKYRNVSSEW